MGALDDDPYFPKNPRFELQSRLGEGGFGVVYEAFDREWGAAIALKVLRPAQERAIVRFKHEFRSLADVRHPNLVTLHELFVEPSSIYFTMDLVRGCDFVSAFRPRDASEDKTPPSRHDTAAARPRRSFRAHSVEPLTVDALPRLVGALRQLAGGLGHLHRAGWIHRDIKPSNVMVGEGDHVVLVDFGLVDQAKLVGARDPWTGSVPGTPGYIAPEQIAEDAIDAASDCWSVGVVIAEVLLGAASQDDVRSALARSSDARTRALLEIAVRLLEADPRQRASLDDLVGVLEGLDGSVGPRSGGDRSERVPFVGRERERAVLASAFADLERGEPSWVRVRGAPGVGKSAVLTQFIADVSATDDTWVFSSTCRDRELVPFRGIDALMDQLGVAVQRAPDVRAAVAQVSDVGIVAATFPALALGPAASRLASDGDDSLEFRRRVFNAWRDVLAVVGSKRRLVLVIDDAHWGDADSGLLLSFLVERPAPVLVIVSLRSEGASNPFSSALDAAMARHLRSWIDIDVEPMTTDEAHELALSLVTDPDGANERIERVVHEAGGVPLFLVTLAAGAAGAVGLDFDALVARRLESLSPAAAAVIEATSISTIPIREDVLLSAIAGIPDVRDALVTLDVGRLIRRRPHADGRLLEPFHDRVRQAVLRSLTPSVRRQRHGELAAAFRAHLGEESRPDILFVHYAGAGEDEVASVYGERAASKAQHAMAFDRASSLFSESANLTTDRARRHRLLELAGDALAAGGRTASAAALYEELARAPALASRTSIQRKAAEAYLITGHQEQGLRIWQEAARGMGLRFPRTPLGAAVGAVLSLLRARFRWLARLAGSREGRPQAAARSEASLAAAKGLVATDPMHGVFFGAESLAHARTAGEVDGLVTSLSFVAAACLAAGGGVARRWALDLLEEAASLASASGASHLGAIVTIAHAQIALFQGRWSEAADGARDGLATLAAKGHARDWEASMARVARLRSLEELGSFGALMEEAEEWRARAEERGDVYGVVTAHLTLGIGSLATRTADAAELHAQAADERWRGRGYSVQRFYAARIRVLAALQRGEIDEAARRLERVSRAVRASMIFRIPTGRIDTLWMEARVALGRSSEGDRDGKRLIALLRRHARALDAEDHVPARAHAAFIRTRLGAAGSSTAEADEELASAEDLYRRAGMIPMALLVHASRSGRGATDATGQLAALGIADPVAWARGHGIALRGAPDQIRSPKVSEATR